MPPLHFNGIYEVKQFVTPDGQPVSQEAKNQINNNLELPLKLRMKINSGIGFWHNDRLIRVVDDAAGQDATKLERKAGRGSLPINRTLWRMAGIGTAYEKLAIMLNRARQPWIKRVEKQFADKAQPVQAVVSEQMIEESRAKGWRTFNYELKPL